MTDDLAQSAQALLAQFKDTRLPPGSLTDAMPDKLQQGKGFRNLLQGLAEFIDHNQEFVSVDGNKALLARLRAEDGIDIGELLVNAAMGDAGKAQLEAALSIRGQSVLDLLRRAVKTIGRDKQVTLEDNIRQAKGDDAPPPPPTREQERRDKERDKDTWHESKHAQPGEGPDISAEDIRKSADEHDKSFGPDENVIRRAAQEGAKEFRPPTSDKTEYERQEDTMGLDYLRQQSDAQRQVQAYYDLLQKLKGAFESHLGPPAAGRVA
jgi:hypothetical protein